MRRLVVDSAASIFCSHALKKLRLNRASFLLLARHYSIHDVVAEGKLESIPIENIRSIVHISYYCEHYSN